MKSPQIMNRTAFALLATTALFSAAFSPLLANEPEKPHVLFIAIDDLNDYISPLDNHPGIHTPNFERLAKRSVTLANAHCAAPACHPSRVAVMTGVHPTTSGIYRNLFRAHGPRWRHESPVLKDALVLSQHFRNHGYRAVGGGKIFHTLQWTPGDSQNDPDAWDGYRGDPLDPISADWPRPELPAQQEPGRPLDRFHFGAAPLDPGHRYGDELVTDWAIDQMNGADDEPLFLAVGLFRPHIPFEVPQKWFDLYPEDEVQLPPYRADDLDDAHEHERVSWHRWVTENNEWKPLMRGYLASISYIDHEVGRLLDALDASPMADNTIVVLWSDHGFHIGEKDNWEKFALWDQTTRVPCFIHAPGVSADGARTRTPVSLVDLYPTLCELAGLPIPEQCDGESLVPILKNPGGNHGRYAISSYQFQGEDTPSHAVIEERYRLIRNGDGFEELYDLDEDPNEFTNRIDDPALAAVRERLTSRLPKSPADQVEIPQDSPYNLQRPNRGAKQAVANTPFAVSFEVRGAPGHKEGVLVANGGSIHGYAIYLKANAIHFAVRRGGVLHLASSDAALPQPPYAVAARLNREGKMTLSVNGETVATASAGGLIPRNPNEGFVIGADPESPVGAYEGAFPFGGSLSGFKWQPQKE